MPNPDMESDVMCRLNGEAISLEKQKELVAKSKAKVRWRLKYSIPQLLVSDCWVLD